MPPASRFQIVVSALVIAGFLYLGGSLLAAFAHWDPCLWLGAFFFIGPVFSLVYLQYAATFRASVWSANFLRILFLLIGAGAAFLIVVIAAELLVKGIVPTSDFLLLPGLLLVLALLGFCGLGVMNHRRHRQLAAAPVLAEVADGELLPGTRPRGFRFHLRPLLVAIAALSVVLVLAGIRSGIRDIPPEEIAHASPREAHLDLPPGAADVCVRRGSRGTIAYNFAIDESGFWQWTNSVRGSLEAQTSGTTVEPIRTPCRIFDPFSPDASHTIRRGWSYHWQKQDRELHYAYDADQQRAYLSAHSH